MTSQTKPTAPLFRVGFSRITGTDADGKSILSRSREIGAVWPRKSGKPGGILQLDIVPVELAQHKGVIFLTPVTRDGKGGQR